MKEVIIRFTKSLLTASAIIIVMCILLGLANDGFMEFLGGMIG